MNSFLNPTEYDTYQIDKARQAIERGGLFGVGPGEGTVKRTLPDAHTDFVYAVAGEEFGLILLVLLTVIFAVIAIKGIMEASKQVDVYQRAAGVGLYAIFGLQAAVNMSVNLSLIPPKGMTLPLVSSGGSSLAGQRVDTWTGAGADAQAAGIVSFASEAVMTVETKPPETRPLVVVAAGGTGGHMFPAQAFADEMRARGWMVALVTDERGKKYATNFPADWRLEVEAATFGSKLPHKLIASALKLRAGTADARKNFEKTKPKVVAGFGGYPSYPSLSAARAMGVPIVIHEQNSVLGRVNRLFAKSAKFVACGFDRLDRLPPGAEGVKRVVGNPVRNAIKAVRERPYPDLDDAGPLNILITGGSQGARLFGEVIPKAIVALPDEQKKRLHVVQQAREEQLEAVRAMYRDAGVRATVESFFSDMQDRLAAAHLVIARAGASTVTELAIAGRPSILIPARHCDGRSPDGECRGHGDGRGGGRGCRTEVQCRDVRPASAGADRQCRRLEGARQGGVAAGPSECGERAGGPCRAGGGCVSKGECVEQSPSTSVRSISWALAVSACPALPR